ncbi:hypothetical protein [Micromonospora sp. NPDC001898]|uniref:hypothetical protein n=1 Tax=Micromonospora sp. NPDC001898 TaxID=3364221 RepID=UPI003676612D
MVGDGWASLTALNDEMPDHDHGSTVDNLDHGFQVSEHLECWRKEYVRTGLVHPNQLIDDPDDVDGHMKVESIGETLRAGEPLPAVVLIHQPDERGHPYQLIEGRHRYNAIHREGWPLIFAWVAHVSCCGGPGPDL